MDEYITSFEEAKTAIYKGTDIDVENLKVYDEIRSLLLEMAEFFCDTNHWVLFGRCQEQIERLDKEWGERYNKIVIGSVTRIPILKKD